MLGSVSSQESSIARWARRGVTVPTYVVACLVVVLLAPLAVIPLLLSDLVLRRKLALTRSLLMANVYLIAEVAGIIGCGALWARHQGWRRTPGDAYLVANFRLQCRWASALFWSARRIFGLRVALEDEALDGGGPVVLIGRHVSPIDNLVPAVFVSARHGTRLRWVMNRWLLRDPCLDIVGNRLPNVFVGTERGEVQGQSQRVSWLAQNLGPNDGILLYPEGALFSPGRLERALETLATSDPDAHARATSLRHTLPPRMGGVLAALAAAPDADLVVCRHTGLEAAGDYRSFLSGGLVGATVRISFDRIERSSLPDAPDALKERIWDIWQALDDWIAESSAEEGGRS